MMMAGLDGIQNKIHPGEPLDKDIYDLEPEEAERGQEHARLARRGARRPREDHEFLLRGDVFTQDVINTWISYKHKNELAPALRPHPVRVLPVLRHLIPRRWYNSGVDPSPIVPRPSEVRVCATLQLIVLILILGALAVFALQNSHAATLQFLNWDQTVPIALLVGIVYLLGMLSGWSLIGFLRRSIHRVTER